MEKSYQCYVLWKALRVMDQRVASLTDSSNSLSVDFAGFAHTAVIRASVGYLMRVVPSFENAVRELIIVAATSLFSELAFLIYLQCLFLFI